MENLKNKKILFVVTQTKWGGAQKYVLELAQYFSKQNEVHLAFGEINDQNQKFLTQAKKIGIKTIPLKNLVRRIEPTKDVNAVFEINKLLSKGNYHLIHLNSSKAGLLGTLAAKVHNLNPLNIRIRVVYTAHGFVFNEPLAKIEKTIYKISEKISTGMQNVIITVSKFDKQSAIENKICNPNKMFVIHIGLDFSQYDFLTREKAREELNLSYDKKYFGTIASFYKTKGHTYLIETIKLLKDEKSDLLQTHQWILIGDGPEKENIEKAIKESQVGQYIKIVKPQNDDWKYLKAFDYFVLPSVKEGLPYTILEAGLAGVPTIASHVGGVPEILVDEKTGLLTTPANPLSLKMAIEKIADNDQLAQNLAKKNKENIEENFNLDNTLTETETLYLRLF